MKSGASTVDAYLREVPADRRAALRKLRELCRERLAGFDESMQYGGPAYARDGKVLVGFASQKQSINFYVLSQEALARHRAKLKGLSVGKGVIRYPSVARIDFDVVADLLTATVESTGGPCGPRL